VPCFSVGGVAKQYLAPGWRLGWSLLHDPAHHATAARAALNQLSQVILGPNSLVQAALPAIFEHTPPEYYTELNAQLEAQAACVCAQLQGVPGLRLVTPRGAMYVMIGLDVDRFDGVADDIEFSQKLLREQSVFVLPGQCFRAPNFFRIVFCAPPAMLTEAAARIAEFCAAHLKK
jgi:tyrosine aminotransferase